MTDSRSDHDDTLDSDDTQEQQHCPCGALVEATERHCRKCRARSRYQHRRNRLRHPVTPRHGRAGTGPGRTVTRP